jgi:hypothetical protein
MGELPLVFVFMWTGEPGVSVNKTIAVDLTRCVKIMKEWRSDEVPIHIWCQDHKSGHIYIDYVPPCDVYSMNRKLCKPPILNPK